MFAALVRGKKLNCSGSTSVSSGSGEMRGFFAYGSE